MQVQIAGTSIEMSKDNMIRLSRVLLPPDPEVLSRYCKQGFEDALSSLLKDVKNIETEHSKLEEMFNK